MTPLKDEVLASLAERHNVAQFASFAPGVTPKLRYSRLRGDRDAGSADLDEQIALLLTLSAAQSVNIRSFRPDFPKGNPFTYGVDSVPDAVALVRGYAAQGYYTIVNETIDVADGGVSGVALGGVIEFAPGDTPRAVERPGVVAFPHQQATELLTTVYGFRPELEDVRDERLEFSIHPLRVGYRRTHTLLWERASVDSRTLAAAPIWPNSFSRLIGDKPFGLLVASFVGVPVPYTRVVPRRLAPFEFGRPTGTKEWWLRTCPPEPVHGHYTTCLGWRDPMELLKKEDPAGTQISSVLAQEAVDALYSGATRPRGDDGDDVEGVAGRGDRFMLGLQQPDELPSEVVSSVRQTAAAAREVLGPVRLEWAFDGNVVWVLQLHLAGADHPRGVISPGEAQQWLDFDPREGLEYLSRLVREASATGSGVRVLRSIGITSHVGEILRESGVPATVEPQPRVSSPS
jgi:hypothetical protein